MGSDSDLPIMQEAINVLESFNIAIEVDIVSAHRTPEKLVDYSKNAHKRGIKVIIAGAGGAAHLPGMVASMSPLPIIGVPVKSRNSIDGWDSVSVNFTNARWCSCGYCGFGWCKKCRNFSCSNYRRFRQMLF